MAAGRRGEARSGAGLPRPRRPAPRCPARSGPAPPRRGAGSRADELGAALGRALGWGCREPRVAAR